MPGRVRPPVLRATRSCRAPRGSRDEAVAFAASGRQIRSGASMLRLPRVFAARAARRSRWRTGHAGRRSERSRRPAWRRGRRAHRGGVHPDAGRPGARAGGRARPGHGGAQRRGGPSRNAARCRVATRPTASWGSSASGCTGAPGAEGGRHGHRVLTERELEVARLVVDRKTNAQIAEELFLSPKTVETHIRHLFQKLEVSSRVEVARVVERADREGAAAPETGSGCEIRVRSRCSGSGSDGMLTGSNNPTRRASPWQHVCIDLEAGPSRTGRRFWSAGYSSSSLCSRLPRPSVARPAMSSPCPARSRRSLRTCSRRSSLRQAAAPLVWCSWLLEGEKLTDSENKAAVWRASRTRPRRPR